MWGVDVDCDRHRLGGPDRIRIGPTFCCARALRSSASRTTCGRDSSGHRQPRHQPPSGCCGLSRGRFAHSRSMFAIAKHSSACSRPTRLTGAGDPHRGAAVARLGSVGSADRLHDQRQRDAQPARGTRRAHAVGDVRLLLDEQGLRGPAEPAASASTTGDRLELPAGSPLLPRNRYVDVDRRLNPLALRRLARWQRICSSRSTGATSGCPPSVSGVGA